MENKMSSAVGVTRRAALLGVVPTLGAGVLAACAAGVQQSGLSLKVDRPVTVTLLPNGNVAGTGADVMRAQYEKVLRAAQPNITIDFQGSGASGVEHVAKILSLSVAGTPPDVFYGTANDMPSLVTKNLTRALDDLIRADSSFKKDEWFDVHLGAWLFQGKQRGLPWQGGPVITYFNMELLTEAGVAAPVEATWTIDAWRDAGAKLRRVLGSGETPRWATDVGGWLNWVYAYGGDVLDKELKKCVLDSPQAQTALQLLSDFIHRDQIAPKPQDTGGKTNVQLFMEKRNAIITLNRQGASAQGFIQPWVAVSQLPKGPAGRFSPSNIDGFLLGGATKEPAAAWEVAKWRTGDELRREFLRTGNGGVPALKVTANSPEYLNDKLPPDWNRMFVQTMNIIRLAPPIAAWPDVLTMVGQSVTQIQRGEVAPASAIKDLVPRVNALLQGA